MSDDIAEVEFDELVDTADQEPQNIEIVSEIPVKVSAELGHTTIPIRELLSLGPGSVIELDRLAGESIDLLVNGVLIGRGNVVIVNENFGLRITEIVQPGDRLNTLAT